MSKVTNIFNLFENVIIDSLPGKTKIPNPFSVENNSDNFLKDGYGIYYGAAAVSDIEFPTYQVYSREIVVIFTREVHRVGSDSDALTEKQNLILEDQNNLIDSLANSRNFDSDVIRLEFTGDSGLDFVFGDKFNFLSITTTFEVSYKEELIYCYP